MVILFVSLHWGSVVVWLLLRHSKKVLGLYPAFLCGVCMFFSVWTPWLPPTVHKHALVIVVCLYVLALRQISNLSQVESVPCSVIASKLPVTLNCISGRR